MTMLRRDALHRLAALVFAPFAVAKSEDAKPTEGIILFDEQGNVLPDRLVWSALVSGIRVVKPGYKFACQSQDVDGTWKKHPLPGSYLHRYRYEWPDGVIAYGAVHDSRPGRARWLAERESR